MTRERIMERLHENFRPEFLNRLDVLPFKALSIEEIKQVICKRLIFLKISLSNEGKTFIMDEIIVNKLADLAYSPKYGIRQLDRVIEKNILMPIYGNKWYEPDWKDIKSIKCSVNSTDTIKLSYETKQNFFSFLKKVV